MHIVDYINRIRDMRRVAAHWRRAANVACARGKCLQFIAPIGVGKGGGTDDHNKNLPRQLFFLTLCGARTHCALSLRLIV